MRMFISDSLQPPGLENLNGPGPSWAILEDRSSWLPTDAPGALQGMLPPAQRAAAARGRAAAGVRPVQTGGADSTAHWNPAQQLMKAAKAVTPNPGQLEAYKEWQKETSGSYNIGGRREGFSGGPPSGPPMSGEPAPTPADYAEYGTDVMDAPWSAGQVNRTPEAAVAEYWGDNWAATDTTVGAAEQAGVAYGAIDSWGNHWRENGGTRFMRYESIPFWQKGGRVGYDYDIEETLGTAGRELDSNVRRWDMERVRVDARAHSAAALDTRDGRRAAEQPVQWGRRFGPRSGGNV